MDAPWRPTTTGDDDPVDYATLTYQRTGRVARITFKRPAITFDTPVDLAGDQRAKRLLLTGDTLAGTQALEWGLAVEAPAADELDERTELLLSKIAAMPLNQLMMVKLALNSALLNQGVANSTMVSTVFDGVSRHTREGYAFQQRAAEAGWRTAVQERDAEPFGEA